MNRPGIEPRSPGPLVNTLTIMPMSANHIEMKEKIRKEIFRRRKLHETQNTEKSPGDLRRLAVTQTLFANAGVKISQMMILLLLSRLIGLVGRVFANGRVIPKTLKMVLDTSLLNTQQYKIRINGKMEQSRERSRALPYTSV